MKFFFSDSKEQKQLLQENVVCVCVCVCCVLEINWLAARDTPFIAHLQQLAISLQHLAGY